ncbi:hypothetical protein OEZ85_007119 [Tetradesmus obliquus]|uniref:F-box domain-containing protein n=1 Tax=Tetradesmus obliquus TaxID=3088 RepID=A0ABY8TX55_TETOB|nr:hypothetical protein OEZ85_007119 [Tetradesmus obliquus]
MCIAASITSLDIKTWPQPQQQQQQQQQQQKKQQQQQAHSPTSPGSFNSAAAIAQQHQRLQCVTRLEVNSPEIRLEHWAQLHSITRQLPLLQHIRIHSRMAKGAPLATKGITAACAASLSSLTRLDMPGAVFNINVPQQVQLPVLRAASFGVVLGTDKLAAFAPHLQQLYCDHLQIDCQQGGPYHAAMPSVTHLGASRVFKHNDAKRDFEDDIALPSDLLELIVQHLPRSDHAAARLTCRDMEKLIAPMLRTLFIKDWEISIITDSATVAKPGSSCKWEHVQHLDLLTEPQWPLLQEAISRLPNLTHLRINTHLDERLPASFVASGALAGLTRLDLGRADAVLPPGLQLPRLLALSFGGCYGRSAAAISAFAPNLQQLFCERLSFAATDDACLPHVTHFGACHMYVSCSASKWAGQRSNAISSSSHASGNVAQLQPLLPSLRDDASGAGGVWGEYGPAGEW